MAVEKQFFTVVKILFVQLLTALMVAAVFVGLGGWEKAFSPLLGGGIALLPNILFAYKIYLARHLQARGVVNAFYIGETLKLISTVALFAMVLQIPGVNFLTLLTGYVAVLSVFWFALFYWRN